MAITIPSDLGFKGGGIKKILAHTIREALSNAKNYQAKTFLAMTLSAGGDDYFLCMHSGEPFADEVDILEKGCKPNNTGDVGNAFAGCGLMASAWSFVRRNPQLVVASFCKDGKFHAGSSTANRQNRLVPEQVDKLWYDRLRKLLGKKWMEAYNVFYLFKAEFGTDKVRNYIKTDLMNHVAFLAPSLMDGIMVNFAEKQIGYPGYKASGTVGYDSYEEANVVHKGAGSIFRRAISYDGYVNLYSADNGHFKIHCDPFTAEVKPNLFYEFDDVDVEVILYNGIHLDRGQNTQWFCSERDSNIDGRFKQGRQNAFGKAPTPQKSFLVCPWVYEDMVKNIGKEDAQVFGRFQDNALGSYNRIQSLMNLLGCRYINDHKSEMMPGDPWGIEGEICKNPFATIRVIINSVKQFTDKTSGDAGEAEPLVFMKDMDRRPDFTFEHSDGIAKIMKAACEAAAGHVDEAMKDMCEDLFHYNEDEMVSILECGGGPPKREPLDVDIYVLNSIMKNLGNEPIPVKTVSSKSGESVMVMLHDRKRDRLLGPGDIIIDASSRTRGLEEGKNISEFVDQFPELKEARDKVIKKLQDQGHLQ